MICCIATEILTLLKDCSRIFSVDIDETDSQAISNLQDVSIVCSKTPSPYLKSGKAGKFKVIKCDELEGHVWNEAKAKINIEVGVPTGLAAVAAAATAASASL